MRWFRQLTRVPNGLHSGLFKAPEIFTPYFERPHRIVNQPDFHTGACAFHKRVGHPAPYPVVGDDIVLQVDELAGFGNISQQRFKFVGTVVEQLDGVSLVERGTLKGRGESDSLLHGRRTTRPR